MIENSLYNGELIWTSLQPMDIKHTSALSTSKTKHKGSWEWRSRGQKSMRHEIFNCANNALLSGAALEPWRLTQW